MHTSVLRTAVGAATLVAAVAMSVAGCSSSGSGSAAPQQAQSASQPAGNRGGTPGISGEIAAWSDDVAQVQGSDTQTAVTVTTSTTITQEVAGARSDVQVGSCVMATAQTSDSAASDSGSAQARPTTPSTIDAATIRVTAADSDGRCAAPMGSGGGDGGPSGAKPTDMPSGAKPTDMPSGPKPTDMPTGGPSGTMPTGQPGGQPGGNLVFGTVTAVKGNALTVNVESFDPSSSATASPSASTTATTVNVSADTTFTVSKTVDSAAIKVGLCANAQGKSDDRGGLTATSLALSTKGENGCSTGFGGGPQGGMPGGGPGGQGGESL